MPVRMLARCLGLVIGAGLAAAVATVLISTPAAQISAVVPVFDPFAYVAGPVVIVTACLLAASLPALRAARIDPITTLRHE